MANLDIFPDDFDMGVFDYLSDSIKENIMKRVKIAYNKNHKPKISDYDSMTSKHISKINEPVLIGNQLEKKIVQNIIDYKALLYDAPIKWDEVNPPLRNNFKKWVASHASDWDKLFKGTYFDNIPDNIKVEWIFSFAKKFGAKYYDDLKTKRISLTDMKIGVKQMKLSPEIQDAIQDAIPDEKILNFMKKSDMDTWSAVDANVFASEMTKEEIRAIREKRKSDKKIAKLYARARTVGTIEGYESLFSDVLFDRKALDIVLKRAKNNTLVAASWYNLDKEIIKVIVNNKFITTQDLLELKKIRSKYGSSYLYNSKDLDIVLSKQPDLSEDELMKLIKKNQYDVKLEATKKDLSPANKKILIQYIINHNASDYNKLKTLFDNLKIKVQDYNDQILKTIIQKNSKTPIKILELLYKYNFNKSLSTEQKNKIVESILSIDLDSEKKLERLLNVLDNLNDSYYSTAIYEKTGDEKFLGKDVKDIFLF